MDNKLLTPQQLSSYAKPPAPASSSPLLTREQLANYASMHDSSSPNSSVRNSWDAFDKAVNQPKEEGVLSRMGGDISDTIKNVKEAISGEGSYEGESAPRRGAEATAKVFGSPLKIASEILPKPIREGVSKIGGAAGGIVNWLGDKLGSTKLAQDFVEKHPDAAKFLEEASGTGAAVGETAGDILMAEGGVKGAQKAVDVAPKIIEKGGKILDKVAEKIPEVKPKVINSIDTSIEAVNPDLTGKKLVSAYKQGVTGTREITPSSIFREQGIGPDEQTMNLGKRLHDLNLGKDPVENLNTLKTALSTTETKIETALKGDPEVNYNANKPELIGNLEKARTNIPREFNAIKDSKTVFDNVIDFAKETVTNSEDSITGIRDARTTFDAQAKAEYPSAFKEGKIDTSTPAGRAIKLARDMINEHLYNTAPNGSEIQKLIGREADIYRATDNIAPKAAKGEGKNTPAKFIKNHPQITKFAKGAGLLVGGEEVGRRLFGK